MRPLILALCLLSTTACSSNNPIGPTVPLDEQFTLARGEAASIDDTSLTIRFDGVTGDSRFPVDAACITGGDATVHVHASGVGIPASYELHTGDSSRATVTHGSFRISLVELQPFPFSGRTIPQEEYRAALRVTRP